VESLRALWVVNGARFLILGFFGWCGFGSTCICRFGSDDEAAAPRVAVRRFVNGLVHYFQFFGGAGCFVELGRNLRNEACVS